MATRSFDVMILGVGNAGMGVTTATREAGSRLLCHERRCDSVEPYRLADFSRCLYSLSRLVGPRRNRDGDSLFTNH